MDEEVAEGADGGLTHLDEHGRAHMVDVSGKAHTARRALAHCEVRSAHLERLDPAMRAALYQTARVAAAQAAKQTADLIPLCHPLRLETLDLEFVERPGALEVRAEAAITAQTGVEMEALTACAIAALTIVAELVRTDPGARLRDLELLGKSGGRSGTFVRSQEGARPA